MIEWIVWNPMAYRHFMFAILNDSGDRVAIFYGRLKYFRAKGETYNYIHKIPFKK